MEWSAITKDSGVGCDNNERTEGWVVITKDSGEGFDNEDRI